MKYFFVLISFLQLTLTSYSQDNTNLSKLNKSFHFNEGIFINFKAVKNNQPIPISNIITSIDKSSISFFDQLLENEEIYFVSPTGTEQTIKTKDIWGYSDNGKLYIFIYNKASVISVVGAICHLVAIKETVYYPYTTSPYYEGYSVPTTQIETIQLILDFSTGKLHYFTIDNIEPIFSRDKKLYAEWIELSKRKKKKLIFVYLRKYNEHNTITLPKK